MPDIKWIKITTEMFDDEKIRIIESMPEADMIIVTWIRLICMAGKTNQGGHIFITPDLPYNDEQFAAVLNRPLNSVRLALDTLARLQMIEVNENGYVFLPAFEKHQNIEGMERVRELAAARQRRKRTRDKVKLLPPKTNVEQINKGSQSRLTSGNATSRYSNSTDVDLDVDLEVNKNEKNNIWDNVLLKLKNSVNASNFKTLYGKSVFVSQGDTTFTIAVPDEQTAKYLEENQRGLIEKLVTEECGFVLGLKVVLLDTGEPT